MAETTRAGMGDSAFRSWHYWCSIVLICQDNLSMTSFFLIRSHSLPDNRGYQPQHAQCRLLSRLNTSFSNRWVHLDTVSRQIFGDIQETLFEGGKMEVHVHLKNAFPGGIRKRLIRSCTIVLQSLVRFPPLVKEILPTSPSPTGNDCRFGRSKKTKFTSRIPKLNGHLCYGVYWRNIPYTHPDPPIPCVSPLCNLYIHHHPVLIPTSVLQTLQWHACVKT